MIKLNCKLPNSFALACSGGVDSMAALDFLSRKHWVSVAFFHHGTEGSENAYQFLSKYCNDNGIGMICGKISKDKPDKLSLEEHWRNERYAFLDSLCMPVVTAHHLDDAVETWVWSSMHGQPKLPRTHRGQIIRPFLTTTKMDFVDWCMRKNVPWYDDPSNVDQKFMRNYIRHTVMPVVQKINPGIQKTIKKRLTSQKDTLY